jgi:hypothetical protein
MNNEERSRTLQRQDDRRSSLPVVRDEDMDGERLKLKLQYFGWVSVPSAILLEIMNAQLPGIGLAAAAGVAAAYFSQEIHYVLEPSLKMTGKLLGLADRGSSGRTMNRLSSKEWWLGQDITPYAEQEQGLEDDVADAEGNSDDDDEACEDYDEKMVELANDLVIPASDLAGKAIFIAGIRRSGKTTLGVRIAEQMSQYDLPLFVPDLEGDWLSAAATTFKYGRILAHPSAEKRYADVKDFRGTTIENADVEGFNILDEGVQAVLDMASYETVEEACQVVVNIIKGLFSWTEQHEDERVPCQVYLDEAQRFLPQNLEDSIIEDKTVKRALLKMYMNIIGVGGKRGLSPVILTQRFAQVNNKIMAQSEVFFLLRQTNDNDLKRCMEYVSSSTATPEEISRFSQGEGVYVAATGEEIVTRFLPRKSSGKRGATPTIDAAARYAQRRAKRAMAPAEDEDEPQARPKTHLRPLKSPDELLLEKGVQVYKSGATSLDKLMAALNITQHKARQLKPRIEEIIHQEQPLDAADGL